MAQVAITINDQPYKIACDDGQESHLLDLADYVGKRVDQLAAAVGDVGESRLLVMTCLLIADELSDAFREVEALRAGTAGGGVAPAPKDPSSAVEKGADGVPVDVATLDFWAGRIEKIARRIEQS
ncbi:cell division protein ZapA [Varunaivibrio sulfuroxidans]|uniref:Cell division protein ZapA n=1 Tax=Varunaivibrio sulfuroxidans TaxID=1773489 RepID=A0A4V2UNS7_9PROT|nr:cell division protein ZapA [Varunaivibrio sulfuroxidans]TCS63141.1 cell division protein ZapA [Varunaivibrio sulfuroxidans]WES31792.1 cell division protein ZapA [Varunaivibrio sulfuroxidans]